jgi:hypothetical protein
VGSFFNKNLEVFHMRGDRETLSTAASLIRLEHAPMLPEFSGEWCDVTSGSGSTV